MGKSTNPPSYVHTMIAKSICHYIALICFSLTYIGCDSSSHTTEHSDLNEDQRDSTDTQSDLDETLLESSAPMWAVNATLEMIAMGRSKFGLLWSTELTGERVTSYVVYQDQKIIATLPLDVNSLQLGQRQPGHYHFQIQARSNDGTESVDGPEISFEVVDTSPPRFEALAQLRIEQRSTTEIQLVWDAALDDVGVVRYRIYQNENVLGETEATIRDFRVNELQDNQNYTFRVEALDAASNTSIRSLIVTIKQPDQTAPSWNDMALINVAEVTESSFWISWDLAIDDIGVSKYRIYVEGLEYGLTEASRPYLLLDGLAEFESYSVEVFAEDFNGNISTSSLITNVQTLDISAPRWESDARVTLTRADTNTIILNWNSATDNDRIAGYMIYQDNLRVGEVDANTYQIHINDLSTSIDYHFRVEAYDRASNISHNGPLLIVQLEDQAPPTWQDSSRIDVVELTASEAHITWTAAIDNEGIQRYDILINETIILAITGTVTSTILTDLPTNTNVTLTIHAIDHGGNQSVALSTDISIPDFIAPIWPLGAQISASEYQSTSLRLSWTPLPVDPSLSDYRIYQNDRLIATIASSSQSYRVDGLTPNTEVIFRVEAIGPTGRESSNGPIVQTMTEELTAPEWPVEAELNATNVLDTTLMLNWDHILLESEIIRYEIYRGDILIGTTEPPLRLLDVDSLSEATTYTFVVRAISEDEIAVLGGPTLTVTTLDLTVPMWEENASITVEAIGETNVLLSWNAANDTMGVVGYRITSNTDLEWDTSQPTLFAEGLEPFTEYEFTIVAYDLAGNQTEMALNESVITQASTFVTSQEVYDGLSPHCAGCHSNGETAYFASFADFESLVINDEDLVVAGAPEQSKFLRVLTGNGVAPWASMPPFGSQNYSDFVEAGDASLSIESLERWVLEMERE